MFNYRDIKQVYTIVFFEQSPKEFHAFPDYRLHRFKQRSDSGLELELLQEYILIPLDICRENMENRPIGDDLGAWLTFLGSTDPVRIGELIDGYPMFKDMYQQIYDLCLDTERVVNMYSKELAILDRNTVLYMIDEMQEQHQQEISQKDQKISQQAQQISQQDQEISQQAQEIAALRAQLAALQ